MTLLRALLKEVEVGVGGLRPRQSLTLYTLFLLRSASKSLDAKPCHIKSVTDSYRTLKYSPQIEFKDLRASHGRKQLDLQRLRPRHSHTAIDNHSQANT